MKIFLCTLRLRIKTFVVYWQMGCYWEKSYYFSSMFEILLWLYLNSFATSYFLFVCLHRSIYANMITYRTLIHKTSLNYKPNVRNLVCLRFEWIFCNLEDLWLDLLNIFVLNLLKSLWILSHRNNLDVPTSLSVHFILNSRTCICVYCD